MADQTTETIASLQVQAAQLQKDLAAAQKAAVAPVVTATGVEPGYTTTEFYMTILMNTGLGSVILNVVHSPDIVRALATIAAAIGTGAYAFGRSHRKKV